MSFAAILLPWLIATVTSIVAWLAVRNVNALDKSIESLKTEQTKSADEVKEAIKELDDKLGGHASRLTALETKKDTLERDIRDLQDRMRRRR